MYNNDDETDNLPDLKQLKKPAIIIGIVCLVIIGVILLNKKTDNDTEPSKEPVEEPESFVVNPFESAELLKTERPLSISSNVSKDYLIIDKQLLVWDGVSQPMVCGLTWDNIDFTNKCIQINKQLVCIYNKGKEMYFSTLKTETSERVIPFINGIEDILLQQRCKIEARKEYLKERWKTSDDSEFSNLLFYTTAGSPATKDCVELALRTVIKKIRKSLDPDFRHMHPHMFRHTFCVKCYCCGVDPKVTQTIMGHADFNMTMNIYTSLGENMLKDSIQKLNGDFIVR